MVASWVKRAIDLLPQGSRLPPEEWRRRHQAIVLSVLVSAVAVALVAGLKPQAEWHGAAESTIPAVMAIFAWRLRGSQRIRAALASAALMVVGVLVVHIFGTIEAHFLFFIMVPVVALYEDWIAFATAAGIVFGHHVLAAATNPASLYNHQAAIEAPILWALIHGGLFLAMCVISVVHWNIHEKTRAAERRLLGRLEQQALEDPMTGVGNRELLNRRLIGALREAETSRAQVALIMVDIDGFKHVNDMYGHAAGDALLIEIADRLRLCTRGDDTLARIGGDEFAILLAKADATGSREVAQRIVDVVGGPAVLGTGIVTVGASVGIAVAEAGHQPGQLMKHADAALYAAKHGGRGRFIVYRADLPQAQQSTLTTSVADARAWALYMQELRGEIADMKAAGALPVQTRGPDSARRTLDSLTASIERLPRTSGEAQLQLPERTAIEEFVFHHSMVHGWADSLVARGILTVQRTTAADRFWLLLENTVKDFHETKPQQGKDFIPER